MTACRSLASTPPGMPGTHSPNFMVGGTSTEITPPPMLLRAFGYSRPILVALRSLSLKPISFGYKTSPIRFSQAGGQSTRKARPPNLQLPLTPLLRTDITTPAPHHSVFYRPGALLVAKKAPKATAHIQHANHSLTLHCLLRKFGYLQK